MEEKTAFISWRTSGNHHAQIWNEKESRINQMIKIGEL